MVLLLACVCSSYVAAAVPVKLFANYNQALHVAVSGGTSKGGTIVSLGKTSNVDSCKESCLSFKQRRCWSFVHKKSVTSYKIRSTHSNKTLHANDGPGGDKFFSTRFQTDDGYSLFEIEDVASKTYQSEQAVRIRVSIRINNIRFFFFRFQLLGSSVMDDNNTTIFRQVVADGMMAHADDEGTDVVSTRFQGDDDYNHFYLLPRSDGTYNIQTKASGRYWYVKSGLQIVYTTKNPEDTSSWFTLEKQAGSDVGGECFAVLSPGFNPSYDETAVSGVVDWPCRDDADCSLNGKCSAGVCACRPAWKVGS